MSTALDESGSAIKIRARDVRMDFAIADERGRKQQIAALQAAAPDLSKFVPLDVHVASLQLLWLLKLLVTASLTAAQ